MTDSSSSIKPLIGRILMSAVFLVSGSFKVMGYSQMVGVAAAKGLPFAGIAIACAAAVELAGAAAMLAGFQVRIIAWLWFLYLIPVTFLFHNFWKMQGMAQQDNMVHFLLNLGLMGGLLCVAEFGAGGYSLDAARAKKA
ncbi:MAG: DoxX family protein [Candidatus Acidiferrales bacterium]